MRTSPAPPTKSASALAPLASCTGTFLSSDVKYLMPSASDLPALVCAPYAARMFHRALPDQIQRGVAAGAAVRPGGGRRGLGRAAAGHQKEAGGGNGGEQDMGAHWVFSDLSRCKPWKLSALEAQHKQGAV